jgi:serine/threonine protein kinase/ligand-binding sensor domain-containing protein
MDHIQPGQMLGPYRIISQVGEGGMATVYKAYHAAMDRYVAIKVLPPEFARSAQFKGRFQQEARLIANLEHPHILPVHDVGESDGIHFFVMRFMDTGTLTSRIESGPLSLAEIDRIFTQITDALGYAHGRNIIHRDIKPSNVLIDSRGDVFLTDFGIAKILEGDSKFSTTGSITGTPAYMSPEQAQGERVDLRSDIYSLGIVLYEMVSGRVPFEAETPMAVALKHISAPLPLPSSIKPDIDPEIERVILKALAKDRNDRYATCQELSDAWRQAYQIASAPGRATAIKARTPIPVASGTIIGKRPATQPDQPLPQRKPSFPWWLAAGFGVIVLIVCIGLPLGVLAFLQFNGWLTPNPLTPIGFISPTPNPSLPVQATQLPPGTAGSPAGKRQWQNWLSSNVVYRVAVSGDTLYALSPAHLTIWNRTDGTFIKQLTAADGLPSTSDVTNLLIDSQGLVWITTYGGLYNYDGLNLVRQGQEQGLDSDNILTLYQLRDGRLLAGTYSEDRDGGGGLNFYDGKRWREWPDFPSLPHDQQPDSLSDKVNAIAEDADGILWVGTATGLGRYDGSTWTRFTTTDGLPRNNILALHVTQSNSLLIGTEAGAALYSNNRLTTFPLDPGPKYMVIDVTEDAQGRYWFSGDEGLRRYDPNTDLWKFFDPANTDVTSTMFGIAQDSEGRLYFGSNGHGVVVVDSADTFSTFQLPNWPLGDSFGRILVEPSGKIWFDGNSNQGPDIFDPQTERWSNPPNYPGSILRIDSAGNLWNNEWPSGFWILQPDGTQTHITDRHGLAPDSYVYDFAFGLDGTVWLSTSTGLQKFDGKQVTFVISGRDLGFPDDEVLGVFVAKDGSLWAGGNYLAAHQLPDGTWESLKNRPFENDSTQVRAGAEDADGALWVGTNGDGLYRYQSSQWTQFRQSDPGVKLPSDIITALAVDANDNLWIGTEAGLAIYRGDDQWERINPGVDTYFNSRINSIYIAPDGAVYLAQTGGIARFKP